MEARASRPGVEATDVVDLAGGPIEYTWIDGDDVGAPLVLLHEGLGCVALWRDFPTALAQATGRSALVYSRYGYGASGPARLPRGVEFMHTEALEVLPELVARLAVPPMVLVGHSDGASIALIAAGRGAVETVGVAVLAPHVFVEDSGVAAIEQTRQRYLADERFRAGLARFHRDPDLTFWGWNDIWLADAFRSWDITDTLWSIDVPVAAVQGRDDPYGTLAQLEAIETRLRGRYARVVMETTGHAPHLEHPAEVVAVLTEALADVP